MSDPEEEPVLSTEETSALLDAMKSNDLSKEPVDVDLAGSENTLTDCLRYFERKKKKLPSQVRNALLTSIGCMAEVEMKSAKVRPTKALTAELPEKCLFVVLQLDQEFAGFIAIPDTLISFSIDRLMGAPEGPGFEASERPYLSEVDKRIVSPVLKALLHSIIGKSEYTAAIEIVEIEESIGSLQHLVDFESLLSLTFSTKIGNMDDLLLTYTFSKDAARLLTPKPAEKLPVRPGNVERRKIVSSLKGIDVQVTAFLGSVNSTVRDVLSLKQGDVLQTKRSLPQPIEVGLCSKKLWA